ncbi:MAG: DUF302 domain-containing protein [Anaerolineales bacterium]|jgi:uncharacterized protein (DUF302 family)
MIEDISFQVQLTDDFETAIIKVTDALQEEGFGVITEIDVKATLKKMLNEDFHPYIILGAANPALVNKALQDDPLIGLFLPYNVTIEETEGGSLVNLLNPKAMLLAHPMMGYNPSLIEVVEDAYTRLSRVADNLKAGD